MAEKKTPLGGGDQAGGKRPYGEKTPYHLPGRVLPEPGRVFLEEGGEFSYYGQDLYEKLQILCR